MIQTRDLRPGDVVATFDQYGGRIDRAVDLTLPLRPPVWRTVAAVVRAGISRWQVQFTDGTRLSTWGDMVWHRLDDDLPCDVATQYGPCRWPLGHAYAHQSNDPDDV